MSQRRCDSKEKKRVEKKRKNLFELDIWSQPRNWSEFIHKFICRRWVWSCRSEEVGDVVIGIVKVLSSVGKGPLDGWSDKSYPGFYFAAVEFQPFLDLKFEDWLVAG